ncbi:MAG TPA: ABC transporter substrate-binding protein [Candidatus Eremiobacteraceae bacterium]|nr:ABC transporter substrate-binding protein [Candidatus Eremiobacteraceae bacterium]
MRHAPSVAAIVLAALIASACSGSNTSSSTGPQGGGVAAGKPHYGGELRIGSGAANMKTLLSLYANTQGDADMLGFMYDGLTNQDVNFKVIPWLAQSWTISPDGKTYVFHLRHDAKWSDGVPITSADFIFEHAVETNPASNAPYASDWSIVQSLSAPDKWTLVYHLYAPNAPFLSTIGSLPHAPLPVHVYGNVPPGQLQHLDLTKHLVTSGGYLLKEWKADDHLTMVSNHNWWHGRPYIDQIYFKEYLDDTATQVALQNGDIDMALQLGTPEWLALKNDPKFLLIHNYADVWDWWVPNLTTPILGDVHVRQAMMYGYDRVTEATKLFHGEDIPVFSPIPLAQKWALDPATLKAYPYDPQKAGQILDADGWKLGPDGWRYKNGKRLEVQTNLIAGNEVGSKDFELLQANMKSIGMKLDAHQIEFNVYFEQEAAGNFELDGGGFGGGGDPDVFQFLSSKSLPPNGLNYARYVSPKMDQLIDEAREATDPAVRAKYYYQIQELCIQDVPDLFDVAPYYRNVINKRIEGVDPSQTGSFFTQTVFTEPAWWVAQ